jgi:spore coat polysaccharide biosynthesis predicted glycosyltransferase SpsG
VVKYRNFGSLCITRRVGWKGQDIVTRRIGLRCDAGPSIGVGHVMRNIALAEELAARGLEPVFFADTVSVPWAHEQVVSRGFAVEAPPVTPAEHVERLGSLAAVVFDSYLLPREVYAGVRAAGVPTMAIIDGELRGAEADLFLDQNIGSEHDEVDLPTAAVRLAGLPYALLRDDVRSRRPASPPVADRVDTPQVLAVFGGTDAFGAAPAAVGALAGTGCRFDATVVAASNELRARVASVPLSPGQSVRVIAPTDRLAELVRAADLVVSAAGSSAWELLTLGASAALVCVADNQETGYRRLVEAGLVVGLGMLDDLRGGAPSAVHALDELLAQPGKREALAGRAWSSVDGQGRVRVVDELLRVCGARGGRQVR